MAGTETDVFGDLIGENGFKSEDVNFYKNLETFLLSKPEVPIDGSAGELFNHVLRPLILSLLYSKENPKLVNLVYGFLNYHLQYRTGIDAIKFLLDLKRFVRIIRLTSGGTLGPEGWAKKFILGISSIEIGDKYSHEISSPKVIDYSEFPIERIVDRVSHFLTNTRVQFSSNLLLYSKFKTFENFFLKTRIRPLIIEYLKKKN